jgi:hypothetical protein
MNAKRLDSITGAQLDASGSMVLLGVKFEDGSSDAIEIHRDKMGVLLNAVLKLCEGLGKIRPNTTSLGDAPLDKVITIPAAEVGVRNTDSGGAWLLFRVGSHDIAALFPERNERLVVAHLLQNSNPQKAPPL